MKKLILSLLFVMLAALTASAQTPNAIPYQAVARDANSNVIANQNISLRFTIQDSIAGGTVVYKEKQSVTTNALGVFSVNIGQGTVVSGIFANINWGKNNKFTQVEMDATGGSSYITMGASQMLSVPYALYAGSSGNLPNGTATGNTLRWNGTAWIADDSLYNGGSKIGIGTSSPSVKLDVEAGSTSPAFKLTDGTQGAGKVLSSDASGNASWAKSDLSTLASSATADFSCMGTIATTSTVNSPVFMTVYGNYAYIVDDANELRIYDVSNPMSPVWKNTGGTSTGSVPECVTVSGNYAYVVDGAASDLRIYDVSNPVLPVWKNTGGTSTGSSPECVAVSGNYAYVADYVGSDLRIYDISNPASPVWKNTGGTSTGLNPSSVAVSGNYAYVADKGGNDLRVYDISNPVSPIWKNTGGTSTASGPISVAVSGNYVYVIDFTGNDLRVYDISNPVVPIWKNTGGTSTGSGPISVAVSGNFAFVADNGGRDLRVYDVSSPTFPIWKNTGGTSTGNGTECVAVSGNYAYVADFYDNDFRVVNLQCPQSISLAPDGTLSFKDNGWTSAGANIFNINNNVGIGTINPTTRMQVQVDSAVFRVPNWSPGLNTIIAAAFEQIGTTLDPQIRIGSGTSGHVFDIGMNGTHGFDIEDNDVARLTILNNGNLGIGTTAPVNKLDVSGGLAVGAAYSGISSAPGNGAIIQGNVGIGTTTPVNILDVSGGLAVGAAYSGTSAAPANGAIIQGNVGIGLANPAHSLDVYGGSSGTAIGVGDETGGGPLLYLAAGSSASAIVSITSRNGHDITFNGFSSGAVENMRITNAGYVGIGTSTPANKLHVSTSVTGNFWVTEIANTANNNAQFCDGLLIKAGVNSYNSSFQSNLITFNRPDGTPTGSVNQTGSNSIAYLTSSDMRLKENIKNTQYGLDALMKIQVRDYTFKDDPKTVHTGFLAQQLYQYYPTAVHVGGKDEKKDPWMVEYGKLSPILVQSVQDQQTIIDGLKKEVEELKAKNKETESENISLKKNETIMEEDIAKIKAQLNIDIKSEK